MVGKRRSAGLVSSDNLVACAAHGLFTGPAADALADDGISRVIVTDSVPPFRLPQTGAVRAKLVCASAAWLR